MLKRGQTRRENPSGPVTGGDAGPLFSSLLVTQPTSLHQPQLASPIKPPHWSDDVEIDRTPHPYDRYVPDLEPDEKRFRHAHWESRRCKVLAALRSSGASHQRVERFEKCGSDCVVEVNADGSKARLRANYCGDRLCDPCCRARGKRMYRTLLEAIGSQPVKFFTFTRRDDGRDLIASLNHLRESWAALRRLHIWTKNVRACAYVIEITRGESGTGWHVHIHAIAIANWVAWEEWKSAWSDATGGSTGVWIKPVHDTARDVAYVCKYATKGIDPSIVDDHNATVEAIIALRARRLIAFTGEWWNLTEVRIIGPQEGWRFVGKLVHVAAEVRSGREWAIGLMRLLGRPVNLFESSSSVNRPSG